MHPVVFSYTPADDDTDGFANDITGAGPWTPTALSAGDGLAHLVSIGSAADLAAITFTLTGTDADGIAQSEAITGPGAGATVYGTLFFKTLTAISASSTLGANTADVGWKDECVSPTHPLNWRENSFEVALGVNISGTINYTVEHCLERMSAGAPSTLTWWPHPDPDLVTQTADADGEYKRPVTATHIHIHSITAGATLDFHVVQGY